MKEHITKMVKCIINGEETEAKSLLNKIIVDKKNNENKKKCKI